MKKKEVIIIMILLVFAVLLITKHVIKDKITKELTKPVKSDELIKKQSLIPPNQIPPKPVPPPEINDINVRKQFVINYSKDQELEEWRETAAGKFGPFIAATNFQAYIDTGEQKYLDKALDYTQRAIDGKGSMFRIFNMAWLYTKYKDYFTADLAQSYKDVLVRYKSYDAGSTENHKLLYRSAAVMAHAQWPDDFDEQTYKESVDYLNKWFDKITKQGYGEHDSDNYFISHIGPIYAVSLYAENKLLRKKAELTIDWYLASVVSEWNQGFWMSTGNRIKNPSSGPAYPKDSHLLMWMLFGEGNMPVLDDFTLHASTNIFALSDFVPKQVFITIAQTKDDTYIHRKNFK